MRSTGSKRLVPLALLLFSCWSGVFLLLQPAGKKYFLEVDEVKADAEFQARLKGPVHYDDPALLDLIKSKYMDPPSSLPYNLKNDTEYKDYETLGMYVEAMKVVRHYLHNKTNGIFVEAGALDGQYLSNSLELEKNQNWTGLLVEASYMNYKSILLKNRKAWVSHSCLAVHPYPHTAILGNIIPSMSANVAIEYETPGWDLFVKGQSALLQSRTSEERLHQHDASYESVQCFPLASLLLALNYTKIDYFSLDVEDVEDEILDNFPFDRITVDLWYIEHRYPNTSIYEMGPGEDLVFVSKFEKRGYTFVPTAGDYVFIRNDSEYMKMAVYQRPVITSIVTVMKEFVTEVPIT
ncbi:protein Star [Hyalella azteca]|uniref:Protein Star n=1 Tax=Hyalella azteca TaxID=294128 RepID=A0A8B7PCH3_HYAAZ|nr:protein Star [Hyalella azteca]